MNDKEKIKKIKEILDKLQEDMKADRDGTKPRNMVNDFGEILDKIQWIVKSP